MARRRHGRRSFPGGRGKLGTPAQGECAERPGIAVKVALWALIWGDSRGEKTKEITLGLVKLD